MGLFTYLTDSPEKGIDVMRNGPFDGIWLLVQQIVVHPTAVAEERIPRILGRKDKRLMLLLLG